jgi:hypothetical protein
VSGHDKALDIPEMLKTVEQFAQQGVGALTEILLYSDQYGHWNITTDRPFFSLGHKLEDFEGRNDNLARVYSKMIRDLLAGFPQDGEIEQIFSYQKPKDDQPARYDQLRQMAKLMAYTILSLTPRSPERTQALFRLRETIMWANAAIACRE